MDEASEKQLKANAVDRQHAQCSEADAEVEQEIRENRGASSSPHHFWGIVVFRRYSL